MLSVGLGASDVRVTLPLAAPADWGAKVIVKGVLSPASSVTGVLIPLKLKPVPVIAALDIVMLVPPVLVTVSEPVC